MLGNLIALGVPVELQAFFGLQETVFDYGGDQEYYSADRHIIPSGNKLWVAGSSVAREMIIAGSVMEIIAMLTLCAHRYPSLHELAFISVGNHPQKVQFDWIRENYRKRKFTLVFPANELGAVADIKTASWLKKKNVSIFYRDEAYEFTLNGRSISLTAERLSLFAFQRATGERYGIRTCKPSAHFTFLEQLRQNTPKRS